MRRLSLVLAALILTADTASAACVNRFVARSDRATQVVTLLTGKLTFQEAQALAAKIKSGDAPRLEWLSEEGKLIARQFGDLKVVRPMPVGCDGRTSGVIIIATFPAAVPPEKKMNVKLDPQTTVAFEEQAK